MPAGQTTRSNPKIDYYPVEASTKITKGDVCHVDTSGFFITATSSTYNGNSPFVCVVTADNSSGAAGAIAVAVVGINQFVTVKTDSALNPGDSVKVSTSNPGRVTKFTPGTDNEDLKVGTFTRKEGGIITKNSTTPYTEQFTDVGDYSVGAAAIGDIVEIILDR